MYRTETASGNPIEIQFDGEQPTINGSPINWSIHKKTNNKHLIIKDHKTFKAEILKLDQATKTAEIKINKQIYTVQLKDKMDVLLESMGIDMSAVQAVNDLKAPMPGLVLDILVEEGKEVKKGDPLLILEAMKMENVLKAESKGVVKKIHAEQGANLSVDAIIIEFEKDE